MRACARLIRRRLKLPHLPITVRFKSGHAVRVWVENVQWARTQDGELTKLNWVGMTPKPVTFNLDAVESIWEE